MSYPNEKENYLNNSYRKSANSFYLNEIMKNYLQKGYEGHVKDDQTSTLLQLKGNFNTVAEVVHNFERVKADLFTSEKKSPSLFKVFLKLDNVINCAKVYDKTHCSEVIKKSHLPTRTNLNPVLEPTVSQRSLTAQKDVCAIK